MKCIIILSVVVFVTSLRPVLAGPIETGQARQVYLAIRTDGVAGSGTHEDPFDASTAAKFDDVMKNLHAKYWRFGTANTTGADIPIVINLGEGTFETATRDSYGPNANGNFGNQHWLPRGWTVRGAGMHLTELRNVNPSRGTIWMFSSEGGSWGGAYESGNITIEDITLNPRKSAHQDLTTYNAAITSANGTTTTISLNGHNFTVGTKIEIAGSYNGPQGPYNGGGGTFVGNVNPNTFSFASSNTATGTVTIRKTGEWNALRLNGGNNKAHRVRIIDAGSNSVNETWPLWLSGDHCAVDGAIVEQCSGTMSAIALFGGRFTTIRNSRVDGSGNTSAGFGVLALHADRVENNYVKNATFGVYGDTFATDDGMIVVNNRIEGSNGAGIMLRPNDFTKKITILGNTVWGGSAFNGITVDPLAVPYPAEPAPFQEWRNASGEKIWIDEVIIANNNVADKTIFMSQARGVIVAGNISASAAFHRMDAPTTSHNRTSGGAIPAGLPDPAPLSPFTILNPDATGSGVTATLRLNDPFAVLFEALATDLGGFRSVVDFKIASGYGAQKTFLSANSDALTFPITPVTVLNPDSAGAGVTTSLRLNDPFAVLFEALATDTGNFNSSVAFKVASGYGAQATFMTASPGGANFPLGVSSNAGIGIAVANGVPALSVTNNVDSTLVIRPIGGGQIRIGTDSDGRWISVADDNSVDVMAIRGGGVSIGSNTSPGNNNLSVAGNITAQGTLVAGSLVSPSLPKRVIILDQKPASTNGGAYPVAQVWQKRDLNTIVLDQVGGVSVANNQVTLPSGTWTCHIVCPGLQIERHKARLRNTTAGSTIAVGSSSYSKSGSTGSDSIIVGKFVLTGSSVLQVEHGASSANTNSFALGASLGQDWSGQLEVENYTSAEFVRVGN